MSSSPPATAPTGSARITAALSRAPAWVFSSYAVAMAFIAYFCMYAFRKPYTAAEYAGYTLDWFGGSFDLKTAFVISQVFGYALSKFAGIKFNSEMRRERRMWALILLIGWAEAALLLFAVLPPQVKVLAIFLNGMPLGMVWGLVFSFLEGRQTSEILGAGLSCAYIVASGWVKSAGKYLMDGFGVDQFWMPVLTGLLFLPVFLLAVYGLNLVPPPSDKDIAIRVERAPMDGRARREFTARYWLGLLGLVVIYFFLTAYRDFRDNFEAELWSSLGHSGEPEIFGLTALPIAFSVMVVLSLLYLIKNNKLGLLATFGIMFAGSGLVLGSTLLFDAGIMSGTWWMILVGLGLYLGYVPYGCVLFDRMIAALGLVATAVFLIYLSDAIGYSGSVGILLYKELGQADLSVLDFFRGFSYAMGAGTMVLFVASGVYFLRRAKHP